MTLWEVKLEREREMTTKKNVAVRSGPTREDFFFCKNISSDKTTLILLLLWSHCKKFLASITVQLLQYWNELYTTTKLLSKFKCPIN